MTQRPQELFFAVEFDLDLERFSACSDAHANFGVRLVGKATAVPPAIEALCEAAATSFQKSSRSKSSDQKNAKKILLKLGRGKNQVPVSVQLGVNFPLKFNWMFFDA